MNDKLIAKIINVTKQTEDVWSLDFLVDNKPLRAEAGQYISVYFDDTDIPEGKAYSLSSFPGQCSSQITVKRVGLFSNKITDLKVGDKLKISQPYGFFDAFLDTNKPAVFIGCGVGISPLYSIINYNIHLKNDHKMDLFYTNKTDDDIIFYNQITKLEENQNFKAHLYITRQKDSQYFSNRLTVSDINNITDETCFYICGTTEFTRSIWRQLKEIGINDRNISVEVFFGANDGSD